MKELERLLNEAEANQAGFPALRAWVMALYRHYEAGGGIIGAYLDLPPLVVGTEGENRQREIDAAAAAWLETAVKG